MRAPPQPEELAEAPLRRFAGAVSRRVVDRSHGEVPEHAHDWPVLSLYVLGGYRNRSALGELEFSAPSVVLYAAGAAHANRAGPKGFEQIEVEFDPAWLGGDLVLPGAPVRHCVGGAPATAARDLARLWASPERPEAELRAATRALLILMARDEPRRRAAWVDRAADRIAAQPGVGLSALAAEAGLHPSWLGQAYGAATGETLRQAAMRRRLEIAARLLRETQTPAAQVAVEAGFCDQSHMVRGFRRMLGRTPGEVRADGARLRALQSSNIRAGGCGSPGPCGTQT